MANRLNIQYFQKKTSSKTVNEFSALVQELVALSKKEEQEQLAKRQQQEKVLVLENGNDMTGSNLYQK